MSQLADFYLAALDADITCAPPNEFSARMQRFYCLMIMTLEASQ